MKEQIMKIFREAMGKMFRCTVDLIENGLIPAHGQYVGANPITEAWSAGYQDACRFIAEALQKQAERFEQSEPEPEPKPELKFTPEFQEGDLVSGPVATPEYFWVTLVIPGIPCGVHVIDVRGVRWFFYSTDLKLIHRCKSKPEKFVDTEIYFNGEPLFFLSCGSQERNELYMKRLRAWFHRTIGDYIFENVD